MKSHPQAKEDVILWRALSSRVHHDVGFWIDVGAYDPHVDSVTKEFLNHRWRGINIEPIEAGYRRLVEGKPNDINVQAMARDTSGEVEFHEIVGHQLGTVVTEFADRHAAAGFKRRRYHVPALTLSEICERHGPPRIRFLKIDVEIHEGQVISAIYFERFRPWILAIEATEPNNIQASTSKNGTAKSQPSVTGFFTRVCLIGIAEEHPELFACFSLPPDDYVLARDTNRLEDLEREVEN